jgi:nucleotide-binding universal stress UspA family protein
MKGRFDTILVPHDLSRHAGRALRLAADLIAPRGRLIVLHVISRYGNAIVQQRMLEDGRRRLERSIAWMLRAGGGVTVEPRVESGDPYQQIAKAARAADLIVMCTAGRTGLAHAVIGSVAEKVVRHAPVPVLTFRPTVRRA